MLPAVDPAVLQQNPNFEVLYKDLTTRKLNADGSTRDTKKQRVHDEIRRVCTHPCMVSLPVRLLFSAYFHYSCFRCESLWPRSFASLLYYHFAARVIDWAVHRLKAELIFTVIQLTLV